MRQGRHRGGMRAVAQDDRGVAQQPATAGTQKRCAAETLAKAGLVEKEKFGQVDGLRRLIAGSPHPSPLPEGEGDL